MKIHVRFRVSVHFVYLHIHVRRWWGCCLAVVASHCNAVHCPIKCLRDISMNIMIIIMSICLKMMHVKLDFSALKWTNKGANLKNVGQLLTDGLFEQEAIFHEEQPPRWEVDRQACVSPNTFKCKRFLGITIWAPGGTGLASPSPTHWRAVPDKALLFKASHGPDSYSAKRRPGGNIFQYQWSFHTLAPAKPPNNQISGSLKTPNGTLFHTFVIVGPVRQKVSNGKGECIVVWRITREGEVLASYTHCHLLIWQSSHKLCHIVIWRSAYHLMKIITLSYHHCSLEMIWIWPGPWLVEAD